MRGTTLSGRVALKLIFAFAPFFIAACASSTGSAAEKPSENALLKAAANMQARASASYTAGDLVAALAGFEGAAKLYESLALAEPQAVARLSAARVLAESPDSKTAQALAMVQRVLADGAELSPATRITAHGRAAALHLASNDAVAASTQLQSAQSLCAGSCEQAAALLVLRARLQLAQGDAAAAVATASQALADPTQQANALRARAQAQAQLGAHAQVIADAAKALELDRAAGQSTRVQLDLQLLAAAHRALGQSAQAQRYEELATRAAQAHQAVQRGLP